VYRGTDDNIHELWLNGAVDRWQDANLGAQAGAPPADHAAFGSFNAAPHGYYTPLFDAARVVYRADDDHIHELWLTSQNGGWQHADLSAMTGAPRASADPSSYYTPLFDAARVVYRGQDDHFHELWLASDSAGWQHADLSAMTGVPPADHGWFGTFNAAPHGYYTPLFNAARVVYRGDDDHIHELWLTADSGGWQHADLSAQSGAPPALGEPCGYYTPLFDAARVVYRGADQHVHELWLTADSGGWQHADLSAHAYAGMALGDPHGYCTPVRARSCPTARR
jgi:frataxin-like iron-binding protein CyaY